MHRGLRTLKLLKIPWFLNQCPTLRACCCSKKLMTDASLMGWGAVFDGCPARGLWKDAHISWHINCLEMREVFLALKHFLPQLRGYHGLVHIDKTMVVSYINHNKCIRTPVFRQVQQILLWAKLLRAGQFTFQGMSTWGQTY